MKSIILGLIFLPCLMFSQASLIGEVYDETGETLPGATVLLSGTDFVTSTDAYGFFLIKNVPPGNYKIEITYIGKKFYEETLNLQGREQRDFTLIDEAIYGETVVISSTRIGERMPFTYSNIEKEEIDRNNLGQDMPFLLRHTPSTVVTSDAGAGFGYTGIRIRGSDATRTNVVINDIPLNDAESQGTFWVDLPDFASSTKSIQVQRGVGTSTNGAGAFGATVSLDSKGYQTESSVSLDNVFGSFNTRKHSLNLNSGLLKDHWSFEGRFSLINSDGYIDRASADLKSAYFSGGYFDNNTSVQAIAFTGKEITYQAWNGTPESRINGSDEELAEHIANNEGSIYETEEDLANILESGRRYNYYLYENEVDDYRQDHYQLHFNQLLGEGLDLSVSGHYTKGKGFFEQFRNKESFQDYGLPNIDLFEISVPINLLETFLENPPLINNPDASATLIGYSENPMTGDSLADLNVAIRETDLVRRRWLDNDFYGVVVNLKKDFENFKLSIGGAQHIYEGLHFGEIIWADYASDSFVGDNYYEGTSTKKDFNVYAKGIYLLNDKLSLFADLQYRGIDYVTSGVDNDLVNYNIDVDFQFFNPKFGFNYLISPQDEVYASFAVANKEPNRSDFIDALDGTNPRAENLSDIEVGYKRKYDKYFFDANVYYMLYRDQLVATGALNDVGSVVRMNIEDSYRAGLEIQTAYEFNANFSLGAFATFSQNKIKSFEETVYDYTNGFDVLKISHDETDISFSPNLIAGGSINFSPISKSERQNISFSLLPKYVGSQFLDNTSNDNRALDAYFVSDLLCRFELKPSFVKKMVLSIKVNNVFNELYSNNGYTYSYVFGDTITENFLYPQAGINFLAGLKIDF